MPINPNATATLIISGLALSHYNNHTDKWEILFIRDEEDLHNLRITLNYETSDAQEILIGLGDTISVEVTKPISSSGKYEPQPFHRDPETDDPQDFRWILDFSSNELHDHAVTVTRRDRDNFLNTPNAVFYNYMMSRMHYELQQQQHGTNVGNPEPLAAIGDYTGADIECENDGNISIIVAGAGGKERYEITPKSKVLFNNVCDTTGPKPESDFIHYYSVISDHGETFELNKQPQKITPRGFDYVCETGTVTNITEPPTSIGANQ